MRSARSQPSSRAPATLVGGEESGAGVWAESRERQGAAQGRVRFAPGELAEALVPLDEAVLRPAAGVAYVPEPTAGEGDAAVLALQERVRERFDPQGVLV